MIDKWGFLDQEIAKVEQDYGESSITVEEVLQIPTFKGWKLIAGHSGIKNRCRHLTILETPEGIEWLKGGEFLLSAGYALIENKGALKNIIFRAHKQKLAAIAIKEGRYIEYIPREMIEQANEYKIPLIELPYSLVYTEATSKFYETLFYKKNEYILQAKSLHESLLNLVFENKDVKGVTEALATLTNSSIIVYDSVFNLLACTIYEDRHEDVLNMLMRDFKHIKENNSAHEYLDDMKYGDYYVAFKPITSEVRIEGYMIIISNSHLSNLSKNAANHGRMILSLKMIKDENRFLNEIKIKKAITELILHNGNLPDEFYFNIINTNNWSTSRKFAGVCIQIHNENKICDIKEFQDYLYSTISRFFDGEGFLIAESPNRVFVFYSVSSINDTDILIKKIMAFSKSYEGRIGVSFGISRLYDSIKDIPSMYNDCYVTSFFNREGEVAFYDSLDTIKLLYPLKEDKQSIEYYSKTIKVIEEYDNKNNSHLLNTLECYFKCNMNKKMTADNLFIHIETLRYRLNKIESLTGYSLSTSEGIFVLQMSLKLHKIMKMT